MRVDEAVGRALGELGVAQVFGVVGSGNFHVTNAIVHAGGRFVAARHESGAATMADAYSRMSDTVAALSVHQGCGLTNAMTGITEAAKSRTPMLVLAAEATNPLSNFYVDQTALARCRRRRGDAHHLARDRGRRRRRGVLDGTPRPAHGRPQPAPRRAGGDVPPGAARLPDPRRAGAVDGSRRRGPPRRGARLRRAAGVRRRARGARRRVPRGAGGARRAQRRAPGHQRRGQRAVQRQPVVARDRRRLRLAARRELIRGADLIVGWGCALNMWTMSHGALIGPGRDASSRSTSSREALGRHRPITFGVVGDVAATATACAAALARGPTRVPHGRRSASASRPRIRWHDEPTEDRSTADRIDPRVLSAALDDLLPAQRIVATDSGNFQGYPSAYLSVPDEYGFCMTQAYQSIGLGLATTIGAALAQPDRLPVAALGDGGALMGVSELDTVVRLGLPMVVVVYDDDGYGAEVHHFGPDGHDLSTCVFPETDIAAIARGFGFEAATVRTLDDLEALRQLGRRAAHGAAARRRQGRQGPSVVVARGGLPRPLTPGRYGRSRG